MATSPAFANAVNLGAQLLGNAETDLQVPTTTSTVVTAATLGTRIDEIVVQASKAGSLIATTVAGLVYVFAYDGSTYHLYDTLTIVAITASSTVAGFRTNKKYENFILKTGWSLRCSQSIAGNASILKCIAHGADF